MEKYQERMFAELKELNDKIAKLDAFLDTDTYNNLDLFQHAARRT